MSVLAIRLLLAVTVVGGCNLLHRDKREADASVVEPAATTMTTETETAPSASATTPAVETSASVAPLASAMTRHEQMQEALREAAEYGMIGLLGDDGGGAFFFGDAGGGFAGGMVNTLGSRTGRSPTLRLGSLTVNGRLPPEVIQRVMRASFGRFKLCYEVGLRSNPLLEGRVTIKFVIATDGSVKSAQDGGSDMPDQGVVACVVNGFAPNVSFPAPEGGIVTVVAPIMFSP
jgi:hypothetical protein